jgi:hypothetical protein
MSIDPERGWLEAGITGLPRQAEWEVVVTAEAPGTRGDEIEFVALADGRVLSGGAEVSPFVAALEGELERPYQAVALRREDVWAVGANAIEVVRLEPDPEGDDLELAWDGSSLALVVDGAPVEASQAPALEQLARERESDGDSWVAQAHRLDGDLWEVSVLPL